MKYKPLHSNFDDLQDDVIERIFSVRNTIEDIKDAVAEEIDNYVEAILKEHVEKAKVWTLPGDEACPITVIFSAGEKVLRNGAVDMFTQKIPLTAILDGFDFWMELSDFEPQSVRNLAARFREFADKLSARAEEIERENAEWEAEYKRKHGQG